MADSTKISSLDGLVELSRRDGIDIKPTLLRVLTDLYVNKPTHTNEEERQFVELTRRLLDTVNVAGRAAVAKTLATYAAAPLPLLRQLARDVIAVAGPVLRKSKRLDSDELGAIVDEMGLSHAAIIAARFVHLEPDQDAGESTASERQAHGAPPAAASELSELFFAANAAERREILLNIEFAPLPPPRPPLEASETVRQLERAALQHHVEEVIREIARSLGLASEQARRIVGDLSGEAMVVAAKSLNMPSAVLQRILLFIGPAASQTVERIYDLMRLYDEIKPEAAFLLLTIWQNTNTQRSAKQPTRPVDEGVRAREAHALPAPALLFEQRLHAEALVPRFRSS